MLIDIVIVNWNSGFQLDSCIKSIKKYSGDYISTITIVDNNSKDCSINNAINDPSIKLILSNENLGFGRACNAGAKINRSKYILFLNPDTLLYENTIKNSIKFMENAENESISVCGIKLIDESGKVSRACARFPSIFTFIMSATGLSQIKYLKKYNLHMSEWDHLETRDVDHVIGAFYLVRRSIFESVHGFDERFFVYLEDLDLSLRIKKSGGRIVYFADTSAFHAGGGTSRQIKATRLFYSLRSRLQYGFKNFSFWQGWLLTIITITIEPFSRIIFSILKRSMQDISNTIKGYLMLLRELPKIVNNN